MNFPPSFSGSNRFNLHGNHKSGDQENRRHDSHYEEIRRQKVEGKHIRKVVHFVEKGQEEIVQRIEEQREQLKKNSERIAKLPELIKNEVWNSTEFKKVESRSLRNDDEIYKLKKKVKDMKAHYEKKFEDLEARYRKRKERSSDDRKKSSKPHHRSSIDMDRRPNGTHSSANRSRSENEKNHQSKAQNPRVDKERSSERVKEPNQNKPAEGRKDLTARYNLYEGQKDLGGKDRRAEASGRREYEPRPGPSGVPTARFTRDGSTRHTQQDLDHVDSDDDRFPTTRDYFTRRPRGPGDPPLHKGTAAGKAPKKGPLNKIREQQMKIKRKTFTYRVKEMALNAIERLLDDGMNIDDTIFTIVDDKDKRKQLDDANENNLRSWYKKRNQIRSRIKKYPHVRELTCFRF